MNKLIYTLKYEVEEKWLDEYPEDYFDENGFVREKYMDTENERFFQSDVLQCDLEIINVRLVKE